MPIEAINAATEIPITTLDFGIGALLVDRFKLNGGDYRGFDLNQGRQNLDQYAANAIAG
jgi:hypothetical protein